MSPEERDAYWTQAAANAQQINRQFYPNPFGDENNIVPDNPALRAPVVSPTPTAPLAMPATASASSGWQLAEKVQKNDSGEYRALINGQWTPVSRAQKNESGQFRVMPIGGDGIQAAPEPTSTALNVLMNFGHLAIPGGPALKLADAMTRGATEAGGRVTDVTGSPTAGMVANVGLQAIPMALGGSGAKIVSPALRSTAEYLMQSALKPTVKQLKTGDATTAVSTMLSEGLNATKGGVAALKDKIGALNDQISSAISSSPAQVTIGEAGKYLPETLERFSKQVNPQADMDAIRKSWEQFRNHPLLQGLGEMPVQLAQTLKQGTYKQLAGKYGELSGSEIEAQKAIARGLKDQVAEAVPGVANLNQQESALIKTLNVAERRALLDLNKNPLSLALLAHNPASFAAFMADKSALFKSLAARMLNANSEQVPATAGRLGVAGYEMTQGQQP